MILVRRNSKDVGLPKYGVITAIHDRQIPARWSISYELSSSTELLDGSVLHRYYMPVELEDITRLERELWNLYLK